MLSVILLFVLLVCLCVMLVLKRWKMDRMTERIPPLPGAAPVIGLAHKALHGDDVLLWERLKQWSLDTNDLGGIAKAWFGPIFFISVTDPELFFSISNACLEKNHMYKFASRWLGRGRVTADDSRFKPFFELIFELVDEGILDEDEARNEVDTVVAAGYDTTQTTLLVTLLVLGSRDDVQEKVVEELTEVFSDAEEEVTKAHLSKLVYMEAVIKETLRLHPVIPLMGRVVDKDVKFEKFTLPAGSVVTLNTWGLHRHRGWGTDADVYRPERWLNASTVPDKSFAAFAMGRRSCIGKTYGMMTVKTTLAAFYLKTKRLLNTYLIRSLNH